MIGHLTGILLEKQPPALLVDVQGVGYELEAPMSTFFTLPPVGERIQLFTHLVIKEDGHQLYGFRTRRERGLFRSLIRVSGVGPKLGLTLLSGMSADELVRCIQQQDEAGLTRMPGVGKKTAQRLLIDLKDRIGDLPSGPTAAPPGDGGPSPSVAGDPRSDAISALIALGYKPAEASRLVEPIDTAGLPSEEIIRLALQRSVSSR